VEGGSVKKSIKTRIISQNEQKNHHHLPYPSHDIEPAEGMEDDHKKEREKAVQRVEENRR
jgi:hypothetical protein